MNTIILKKIKDNDAYYEVIWSKLKKAEKYDINASVPAESGIFELFYMDDKKRLNLMYISRVWFGGLRSTIRKLTDPDLEIDLKWKSILSKYDCYYRYSVSASNKDMEDVLFYFSEVLFPKLNKCSDSDRYEDIYLKEESPENFTTV
jgi:hypothetical protein